MNLAQYESLVTDNIKAEDKEKILAGVVNVKAPDSPLGENFTTKFLDHYGRVAVVTYRGIEVMLLFKRATTKNSTLDLSVPPLKNSNDAWMSVRLMDAYPGMSVSDKIDLLEKKILEKDKMLKMLELHLAEADRLVQDLSTQIRKKAPKVAPSIAPTPMASDEINDYLKTVKPIKLNTLLREMFLWGQGFSADLKAAPAAMPDIPPKLKIRLFKKMKRIDKWMKEAKRNRVIVPYVHVKPPEKVKKTKKKISKKTVPAKKVATKKKKK